MRTTLIAASLLVSACTRAKAPAATPADTPFAGVQMRGALVMGVDQYTSTHVFEDLSDGGRIVLDRQDPGDSAGIRAIRTHMRTIAADFTAGNFSKPFQVHARAVPGTDVMRGRLSEITYTVIDRPAGAELRLRSRDSVAVNAIHEFLSFQRNDHHAAGHEGMMHGGMSHEMP